MLKNFNTLKQFPHAFWMGVAFGLGQGIIVALSQGLMFVIVAVGAPAVFFSLVYSFIKTLPPSSFMGLTIDRFKSFRMVAATTFLSDVATACCVISVRLALFS